MRTLTEKTGDLQHYIALAWLVGPRATAVERTKESSTFYTMVGGASGGQLAQAIRNLFYAKGQPTDTTPPGFLHGRVVEFLEASRWPHPYQRDFPTWIEYAYDLPARTSWTAATRQEWASIAQTRLARAISRHLPTLHGLLKDLLGDASRLVQAAQSVGDAILSEEESDRRPLLRIAEVEAVRV